MTGTVPRECRQFVHEHGALRVGCLVAILPAVLTYLFVDYVQTITGTFLHYLVFAAVLVFVFELLERKA